MSCETSLTIYQNPPDEVDLEIKRGQSWELPVTLTDSATGATVDITGFTLYTRFKKSDGTTVVDPTGTIVAPTLGQFTLSLTIAQTEALPLNELIFWDCFLSDGTTSLPIFEGVVEVDANYAVPA